MQDLKELQQKLVFLHANAFRLHQHVEEIEWAIAIADLLIKKDRGDKRLKDGKTVREAKADLQLYILQLKIDELQGNIPQMPERIEVCKKAIDIADGLYRDNDGSLRLVDRKTLDKTWAVVEHELGVSYGQQIQEGDLTTNMENSRRHLNLALQIYTYETYPDDWARANNNLANTFATLDDNKQAIVHLQETLKVWTQQNSPMNWALAKTNLAKIYAKQEHTIDLAISCYEDVLQFYTQYNAPHEWSQVNHNLGDLFAQKQEDLANHIEKAIEHYENALAT